MFYVSGEAKEGHTPEDVEKAKADSHGLGLFVRSLVGLDRKAAVKALAAFTEGWTPSARQLQFLDEVIHHLTEHGSMPTDRLYESPYIDFSPQGVDGVFAPAQVEKLITLLDDVRERAVA